MTDRYLRSSEGSAIRRLDQPHPPHAGMAMLADNDVIVNGNPERLGDLNDGFRHLDIGL